MITLNSLTVSWLNRVPESVAVSGNGSSRASLTWGNSTTPEGPPSGYDFETAMTPFSVDAGAVFDVGTFTHRNHEIKAEGCPCGPPRC